MLVIQRVLGIDANQVNDHVSVPLIKAIDEIEAVCGL
jgi:hypothetical protein